MYIKASYNCIIQLTNDNNESFNYCVMGKEDNIEEALKRIEYDEMPVDKLDINGWKLVDKRTRKNIQKIEGQMMPMMYQKRPLK